MLRKPYVAGQFYSSDPGALKKEIDACFTSKLGPGKHFSQTSPGGGNFFKGGVAPHAGYIYSGYEAAHLYLRMYESGLPETVIVIGPCHRAFSEKAIGVFSGSGFETPLGICETDLKLSEAIAAKPPFSFDDRLHQFEHSIEVQLPFLQHIYAAAGKPLKISAVCVLDQSLKTAKLAAESLGGILKERGGNFAIIASSDFSHYLPAAEACKYDKYAIDEILKLDIDAMYRAIQKHDITICGYSPIAICALTLSKIYSIKPRLLKYGNSGEVKAMPEVVGYAAISFETNENETEVVN